MGECLSALQKLPGGAWFWFGHQGYESIDLGRFWQLLLPVGLMQTWTAVNEGTWYARSAEFLQTPTMQTLRWLRVPGDTLFALGVLAMGWFKLGLLTGHSFKKDGGGVGPGQVTPAPRETVAAS